MELKKISWLKGYIDALISNDKVTVSQLKIISTKLDEIKTAIEDDKIHVSQGEDDLPF